MKNFISGFSPFKLKVGTFVLVILSASFLGIMAPRVSSVSQAEDCADTTRIPSIATFNPFDVTWSNEAGRNCLDFATLSVKKSGTSDYQPSISASNNDQLVVSTYIHNGARQDLGDADMATNIQANFSVDTTTGSSHTINVTLTGQDINGNQMQPKTGSITINTDPNAHIEVVPGSGEIRDHNFNWTGTASIGTQNFGVYLGNQRACFDFARFLNFTVKVVGGQSQNLQHDMSTRMGTKIDGQCVYTGYVTWHTTGYNLVQVKVVDPDNSEEKLVAGEQSHDDLLVSWIEPGKNYVFNLYGEGQLLESKNINGSSLPACGTGGGQINGNISAEVNQNVFCVYSDGSHPSEAPTYTVTGDANLIGQEILWSSYKSQSSANISANPTLEVNTPYSFYLGRGSDGRAFWSAQGSPWTTNDIGYWIKSSSLKDAPNIRASTQSFQVKDCTTATVNPTASLNVSLGDKLSGQCVWNGVVTWNTSHVRNPKVYVIDPGTGENKLFSQADDSSNPPQQAPWLNPGNTYHFQLRGDNIETIDKTVTTPASCQTTAQLTCSASQSSVPINQSVVFTAVGGDTSRGYGWSTARASSANMSSDTKTYTVVYNVAGQQTASVTSIDGQSANCSVQVTANVCTANSNYALNASVPVKIGSTYSTTLNWSSTGSNNVRIAQINPGSSSETVIIGGNQNGTQAVNNLLAGSTYIFKLYDATCGTYLTTVQVITPANQGQLVCSASNPVINSGTFTTFSVTNGGTAPFVWQTPDGNPSSGNGSSISPTYTNTTATAVTKIATVTSSDGQTANCSVSVNGVSTQQGILNIDKQVSDVTTGTGFSHSNTAKNGDTVSYRIRIWAGSSVTINNARVVDSFASGLQFIDGSLQVNGIAHAPGLTSGGLTFPTLSQTYLEITYQAKVTATTGTIVNTARVSADNASNSPQDSANLNVVVVQTGQPTLTITKQVSNTTKGSGYSNSVNADKNDSVRYQVIVRNIGTTAATAVFVSDSNPVGIQPLRNLTVSRTYTGDIVSGVSLGSLDAGASVTLTYDGTVNVTSGSVNNTATVSASNAATQNASATVNITVQNNNGGGSINYCVNYSCNTTTTTTNTYSYIYTNGTTVSGNNYSQLGITKRVRLLNSGSFQESVNANNNDTVEFEIVVTNTGNQVVNNVNLTDTANGNLNFQSGSLRVDGNYNYSGNLFGGNLSLGSLFSGQQRRVTFQAQVNTQSGSSIQNIAKTWGDGVSQIQDDAWVFVNTGCTYNCGSVQGSSVNLSFSKRANNDTKNVDATSVAASKEDYITYTLTVSNNGNSPANSFVITDDLSQVLPYADMSDNGGGTVSGNVISYSGITVPAYGSVSKSFKVRVKYFLADNLAYVMTNTYGNTITIRINNPKVLGAFVAPKTGADTDFLAFAGLMTAAFGVTKKRKFFLKFLSA